MFETCWHSHFRVSTDLRLTEQDIEFLLGLLLGTTVSFSGNETGLACDTTPITIKLKKNKIEINFFIFKINFKNVNYLSCCCFESGVERVSENIVLSNGSKKD